MTHFRLTFRLPVLRLALALATFLAGGSPLLEAQSNYDTSYDFTTLAGQSGTRGSSDGSGSAALFAGPFGVAVDTSGNIYVADSANNAIRKITPAGVVTTLAGAAGTYGSADGTGSAARFYGPSALAVDSSGYVYVADLLNNTIRKITPGGVVSTLAGNPAAYGSTDGTGGGALFNSPAGVAVDKYGNVFVADGANYTIRKITPDGGVTTFAGTAGQTGSMDGPGNVALFNGPDGLAFDGTGNLYVGDQSNSTIRKITPTGVVSTLAGSAQQIGSADGTGSAARFNDPAGVAVDGSGNVYVADDNNNAIRKITPGGVVTTLAASFNGPLGVAVDGSGNLYVADTYNDTIDLGVPAVVPDLFSGTVSGTNTKYSPWFGYYLYGSYPLVYEYNLGYEYTYDAGGGGVYLYDYASGHFFYTQASYFPFVYDFSLNAFLYYYNAATPHRHFYDFGTNAVISE